MVKIKLYIEGGGESALQDTLFREAWRSFFEILKVIDPAVVSEKCPRLSALLERLRSA